MTPKAVTRGVLVGLLAMAAVATLDLPISKAAGLGSAYDVSKLGPQTITVWWLGNQEIPGIEDWMAQSIKLYQAQHPNITVNTVLQSTDTYNTTQ